MPTTYNPWKDADFLKLKPDLAEKMDNRTMRVLCGSELLISSSDEKKLLATGDEIEHNDLLLDLLQKGDADSFRIFDRMLRSDRIVKFNFSEIYPRLDVILERIDKHHQHGQAAPTRTTSATTGQSQTESQQGRGAKTAETVSDGRRQQSSEGAGLNTCFCADPFKDPRYVSAVDLFLKSLDPTELRNRAQQAGNLLNESQVDRLVWTEQNRPPHIHNQDLIKVIKPQEQLGYIRLCRIIKDWGKYPGKLAEMNQLLPADKQV
ncbi:uncharacterized protein LOC135829415 isoform X1 [Sycon ciliatum]|uniref:uncharacterized protein LOC135829415 isoform X1 n=1 Tax=Sycon ciliatum TaxID=27933 RepID=UPI0031F5F286